MTFLTGLLVLQQITFPTVACYTSTPLLVKWSYPTAVLHNIRSLALSLLSTSLKPLKPPPTSLARPYRHPLNINVLSPLYPALLLLSFQVPKPLQPTPTECLTQFLTSLLVLHDISFFSMTCYTFIPPFAIHMI